MGRLVKLKPDEICEQYANTENMKKLNVTLIDNDTVLIEGEAKALEFVGHLLLAQAKYKQDCGFQIGPKDAGSIFFNKKKSTHGFYIHRLPCLENTTVETLKTKI
jgi:hypothetical protein